MKLSKLLTLVYNEFTAPILIHSAVPPGLIHSSLPLFGYDGLCRVAEHLYRFNIITLGERNWVVGYILTYCPSTNIFEYGWKAYKKRPRKRWLKRHIRLLKRKGS